MIYLFRYFVPEMDNPWLSIPARSTLIILLFCIAVFGFKLSGEIEEVFNKIIKRLF